MGFAQGLKKRQGDSVSAECGLCISVFLNGVMRLRPEAGNDPTPGRKLL